MIKIITPHSLSLVEYPLEELPPTHSTPISPTLIGRTPLNASGINMFITVELML